MDLVKHDNEEDRLKRGTNSLLSLMAPPSKCPWLIISHAENEEKHTLFSVSQNCYHTRLISKMCGHTILTCSSYGWWIVKELDSHSYSLLNPTSMQKIQLPSLDDNVHHSDDDDDGDSDGDGDGDGDGDDDYDSDDEDNNDDDPSHPNFKIFVLSASPTKPNCLVAFLRTKFVMICNPTRDVKFIKKYLQLDEHTEILRNAIMFEGKLFCLIAGGGLLSLATADLDHCYKEGLENINLTRLSMTALPGPLPPQFIQSSTRLIESNGELLLVYKIFCATSHNYPPQVWGFRIFQVVADQNGILCWRELKSIGQERTIFIDRIYACCVTRGGENINRVRGNSIYFTGEACDTNMYIFDLDKRSVTTSLTRPNISRRSPMSWVLI